MTKKELLEQLQSSIVSDDDDVVVVLVSSTDATPGDAFSPGDVLAVASVGYRPDLGAYLEATQQ